MLNTTADKNPVIVALDGQEWEDMPPLLEKLRPTGVALKVNDLLVERGTGIIPELEKYGRVFVDLKIHDTPSTTFNTCQRIAAHNPWACTIHASGGAEMAKAALRAFAKTDTILLAVTVLTSLSPDGCQEIYSRQPIEVVDRMTNTMWRAGIRGFVCSPEEVAMLRRKFPGATLVTPGVRSPGAAVGSQSRTSTPRKALGHGANYVVMGSQLFAADDPVAELLRVMSEELDIKWGT